MKKRFAALLLAVVTAAGMTTVALAKSWTLVEDDDLVYIDTDSMDGGDELQPGVTYRLPLMEGNNAFDEDSAEIWRLTVKERKLPQNKNKSMLTKLDVEKGRDGCYYLVIQAKKGSDSYTDTYDAAIEIVIEERGISSSDAKVESNPDRWIGWETDRGDIITSGDIKYGDRVYFKTRTVEEFTIGSLEEEYITEDEYEVENDNPIAVASGIDRSTLIFGDVAEYDARFGKNDRRFNLGYSTAKNSGVVANNRNADMVFISFNAHPVFAGNFPFRIMDDDMKYVYQIDGNKLIELDASYVDGYLTFRTDRLMDYVASDIPLNGHISSGNTNSRPQDTSSNGVHSNVNAGAVDADAVTKQVNSLLGGGNKRANVLVENAETVSPAALKQMAKAASAKGGTATLLADTVVKGVTEGRIYIDAAKGYNLSNSLYLAVRTSTDEANRVEKLFDEYFKNNFDVITLGQSGGFGTTLRVAAKIDLSGMTRNNLVFYSYNSANNSYKQLSNVNYSIDGNGYVHFNTNVGGTIIISSGTFISK